MMLLLFGLLLVSGMAEAQIRTFPDFTDLVEKVGPSVVNIRTMEKITESDNQLLSPQEEQMRELFRRFGLPMPRQAPRPGKRSQQGEEQPKGVGSGFILSSDGFIMTNAHVVDGADEVIVTMPDKREFKAKIIGADKRADVAVVKIEASGLPAVKIGSVSKLKVGEWVIAIGSPFGLDNTVTAGIVSAKQRDTGDYLPFIQTDVAINPGNSGGPLINMNGEVVGINSQIYSRSGGSMGISFSIPIDEAIRVSSQLRSKGRVSRGRIGVQIDQVTKEAAKSLGLEKPDGALVKGVAVDSPADLAGIQAGDVIVKFDGKPVENSRDLPRMVGGTAPNSESTVTIYRAGKFKVLKIQVGEVEDDKTSTNEKSKPQAQNPKVSSLAKEWGLVVSDLTDELKKSLKVKGGVVVEDATKEAARSGLREGDVIIALEKQVVNNLKDFEKILSGSSKSKPVHVLFRRGDWTQYAVIEHKK